MGCVDKPISNGNPDEPKELPVGTAMMLEAWGHHDFGGVTPQQSSNSMHPQNMPAGGMLGTSRRDFASSATDSRVVVNHSPFPGIQETITSFQAYSGRSNPGSHQTGLTRSQAPWEHRSDRNSGNGT